MSAHHDGTARRLHGKGVEDRYRSLLRLVRADADPTRCLCDCARGRHPLRKDGSRGPCSDCACDEYEARGERR